MRLRRREQGGCAVRRCRAGAAAGRRYWPLSRRGSSLIAVHSDAVGLEEAASAEIGAERRMSLLRPPLVQRTINC